MRLGADLTSTPESSEHTPLVKVQSTAEPTFLSPACPCGAGFLGFCNAWDEMRQPGFFLRDECGSGRLESK